MTDTLFAFDNPTPHAGASSQEANVPNPGADKHLTRTVVTVPVKDEAAYLDACLTALIRQTGAMADRH